MVKIKVKKIKSRTIIALVLAFSMLLTKAPVSAATDSIRTAAFYNGYQVKQQTITYRDSLNKTEKQLKLFYSDGMFKSGATSYNVHLASMALALSMSFTTKSSEFVKKALAGIGCNNVAVQDNYYNNIEDYRSGVAVGKKNIFKSNTLIPVIIRGGEYKQEWEENLHAGTTGNAAGFEKTSKQVADYVEKYISDKGISRSKVKILVTGYSRGGAVAALAASRLTEIYGSGRVYGYAFELPRVVEKNGVLKNIWNISSRYDIVCKSFAERYGFTYAGKNLPKNYICLTDAKINAMKTQLKKIDSSLLSAYTGPEKFIMYRIPKQSISTAINDLMKNPSIEKIKQLDIKSLARKDINDKGVSSLTQEEFIDLLFERAGNIVPSRAAFTDSAYISQREKDAAAIIGTVESTPEESIMTGLSIIMSMDQKQRTVLKDAFIDAIENRFTARGTDLIPIVKDFCSIITDLYTSHQVGDKEYIRLVEIFASILESKEIEAVIGKDNISELKKCLPVLVDFIVQMLEQDLADSKTPQTVITVIMNIMPILSSHAPEVNLAWIRSNDNFYNASIALTAKQPTGTSLSKVIADRKAFTAKWNKHNNKGTKITGYQISYSTNKSFKNAKTKFYAGIKSTKKTVRNLKKGKKYFVRVRTYTKIGDCFIYSSWSKKKVVKIKK